MNQRTIRFKPFTSLMIRRALIVPFLLVVLGAEECQGPPGGVEPVDPGPGFPDGGPFPGETSPGGGPAPSPEPPPPSDPLPPDIGDIPGTETNQPDFP